MSQVSSTSTRALRKKQELDERELKLRQEKECFLLETELEAQDAELAVYDEEEYDPEGRVREWLRKSHVPEVSEDPQQRTPYGAGGYTVHSKSLDHMSSPQPGDFETPAVSPQATGLTSTQEVARLETDALLPPPATFQTVAASQHVESVEQAASP